MRRNDILGTAVDIVNGAREIQYGKPENNFETIAKLWNAYLLAGTGDLTAKDVAVMMILFKVARLATGAGSVDSWVDIAGYAACGGEIATETGAQNEAV